MTERGTWTDERVSEKMDSIDSTFNMLRDEIRGLRADNREQFAALRTDSAALRADFSALQRQLVQIGFGLVGVLISALMALLVVLA